MGKEKGGSDSSDDGLSPMAKAMRSAEPYMSAVWRLVGGCAVGVLAGLWIDRHLPVAPWGVVVLSLTGMGVGFYGLMHKLNELSRKDRR